VSGEHDTPIGTPVVIAPGKIFLVGEYAVLDEGCRLVGEQRRHNIVEFAGRECYNRGDVTTFVATHYPELKTFAHGTDGVVNASLEFDIKTLRPTYRLTIGLPGRSNALAIAQRLGLDPDLVAAAKSEINPDDLRADKLLDDILTGKDHRFFCSQFVIYV